MVPPNINFNTPNPKSEWRMLLQNRSRLTFLVPFKQWKLHVPTEVEPWPQGKAERVSVNSFGIGGVNAHVE
jgi:acyl transferase domain-containing protein